MTAMMPQLVDWRKITVRLHPRPGTPSFQESHVGGPMLRMPGRAWPSCDEHPAEINGSLIPRPMVSVAQLYKQQFPEIPYPVDSDLLQIFWCPNDHFIEYTESSFEGPAVKIVWGDSSMGLGGYHSTAADIVDPLIDSYLVRPCGITPERVVEFPDVDELPADVRSMLEILDQREGLRYQYALSVARGWKVGGWASWHSTDLLDLSCPDCDGPVTLLLKVDSNEWDSGSRRWRPVEDRDLEDEELQVAYAPTRVEVARAGELRIFCCRSNVHHRVVLDTQ
ncbi:hypothetical protein [Streptomyces cupreus]|uniref:Uncharacterized protein n=1 Tax=Streptomyces cupreus TaxID=2759956 RepID=A0A7X1MD97_9ACTN|nr:hypothetical protein [Streptomyces cupreus]MBC2907012.1 hypothetical protein [Streptomyces cupreus]